jgi:hypothetical protein
MIRSGLAVLVALFLFAPTQPVTAADATFYSSPHRAAPWKGPDCDAPEVLGRIVARFARTEAAYWHTGVRMAGIVGARQAAFRDRNPMLTAIRYCTATAYLTDGARHDLVFWLRSEQGFAGMGWGVEYCLVGRDRHMSHAPQCRMLRPL